ncbi:hypothetical protein KC19_7G012300 [Ceratodon purpureus]|uniref:Uncharacterized protein n=1 Tax=Ceratodon purpureus TaxID=3225 RepID=A0A8T0H5U6_CERPU|nr:hypothetical protein KC19_7G012300 [Ceratodon purpureus]
MIRRLLMRDFSRPPSLCQRRWNFCYVLLPMSAHRRWTQSRELSQFSALAAHQLSHFRYAWEEKKTIRLKTWLENQNHAQELLLLVVMLGTCMFIGDGLLTPAILGEKLASS